MAHTSLLEWNYNYNNTRTSQAKLQGHILLHLPRREGEKNVDCYVQLGYYYIQPS